MCGDWMSEKLPLNEDDMAINIYEDVNNIKCVINYIHIKNNHKTIFKKDFPEKIQVHCIRNKKL